MTTPAPKPEHVAAARELWLATLDANRDAVAEFAQALAAAEAATWREAAQLIIDNAHDAKAAIAAILKAAREAVKP